MIVDPMALIRRKSQMTNIIFYGSSIERYRTENKNASKIPFKFIYGLVLCFNLANYI